MSIAPWIHRCPLPPVVGPSRMPSLTGQSDPEAGLFHAVPKGVVP